MARINIMSLVLPSLSIYDYSNDIVRSQGFFACFRPYFPPENRSANNCTQLQLEDRECINKLEQIRDALSNHELSVRLSENW